LFATQPARSAGREQINEMNMNEQDRENKTAAQKPKENDPLPDANDLEAAREKPAGLKDKGAAASLLAWNLRATGRRMAKMARALSNALEAVVEMAETTARNMKRIAIHLVRLAASISLLLFLRRVLNAKLESEAGKATAVAQADLEANPGGSRLGLLARRFEADLGAVVDMIETIARSGEALAIPLIKVAAFLSLLIVLAGIIARHFNK
jgi:hypothetical protein